MDWTILWATKKKAIDPLAPHHTAVSTLHAITAAISNGPDNPYTAPKPLHPKNPSLGTKSVVYSNTILFNQSDTSTFAQGEEITLMNWGNAIVRSLTTAPVGLVTAITVDLNLSGDAKTTSSMTFSHPTRPP
ncbi:ribosomal protein L25/Gln-tRNA synthetase [Staphylotrichum tortipilum]|uniref:Ribosomal protein L25/Gln-tRNA synthetase n=1 Tax=Staphylotrichum tortipilum TaxID=2831512 RepID=A0AAN6MKZ0_9PEZI|nr:ribosomal protein L25/Gln-tRNA synthetase [Staphylotrichum longicolle]